MIDAAPRLVVEDVEVAATLQVESVRDGVFALTIFERLGGSDNWPAKGQIDMDAAALTAIATFTRAVPSDATLLALPCEEQHRLAKLLAENVGYVLAEEPEHPDSPHRASPAESVDVERLISDAWDRLLNVDDRNSPEEYPEMALIQFDELAGFMREAAGHTPAPQPGGAVKVKALEWVEEVQGCWWVADAYRIEVFDGGGFATRVAAPQSRAFRTIAHGVSFEEAQAAAQTDYERRILSALDPSPSQWDAGAEAMQRDCAAVVESFAPGGKNYEQGHDDASMRVAIRGAILALPLPTPPAGDG